MSAFAEKPLTITVHDIENMLTATFGEVSGTDTKDEVYSSITELWDKELKRKKKSTKVTNDKNEVVWYSKAYDYWENEANCPLSDGIVPQYLKIHSSFCSFCCYFSYSDGVLGGYGKLTPQDSLDSNLLLDELAAKFPDLKFDIAADCGK